MSRDHGSKIVGVSNLEVWTHRRVTSVWGRNPCTPITQPIYVFVIVLLNFRPLQSDMILDKISHGQQVYNSLLLTDFNLISLHYGWYSLYSTHKLLFSGESPQMHSFFNLIGLWMDNSCWVHPVVNWTLTQFYQNHSSMRHFGRIHSRVNRPLCSSTLKYHASPSRGYHLGWVDLLPSPYSRWQARTWTNCLC